MLLIFKASYERCSLEYALTMKIKVLINQNIIIYYKKGTLNAGYLI